MGGAASALEGSKISLIHEIPQELQSWASLPQLLPGDESYDASKDFRSWEFDIWQLNNEQMVLMSMHICNDFNFPTLFGFETSVWLHFVWEVQRLMSITTNPYHNFRHIMDVSQSVSCIVNQFSASFWLHDFDMFAVYISAIVHDLEHPGTNNVYQVNAMTPLALRYNDISVLENHHCSKAFEVFALPQCNITHVFKPEQNRYLRKTIISLVLITDMTQHFNLRGELDSVITRHTIDAEPTKLDEKDTLVVLKAILHTSDISNPAKPWATSKRWSDLVLQEFLEQGDREKVESLPVSMNCDRNTTQQDELSLNFCDFIVAPFFFSMAKLLPKMLSVCKILEANRDEWNNMYTARAATFEDENARKEGLDRWAARRSAFADKILVLETSLKAAWTTPSQRNLDLTESTTTSTEDNH